MISIDTNVCFATRRSCTELATRNTRDFDGFGFARVFDPIAAGA
jgi:hypothetical protein